MCSERSAFLGDADFPKSALAYYRDGRQVLIQDLYERYSALDFTQPADRSVGILGLQERLARAFRTPAAFGFFGVYLGRGLLWRRRDLRPMSPIAQPAGRHVPSWSWFGKNGPIKYLEMKFDEVDWATGEFEDPFATPGAPGILRAFVRRLVMTKGDLLVYVRMDEDQEVDSRYLACAIIGRDKGVGSLGYQRQHVLVLQPVNGTVDLVYERIGVASLKPARVSPERSWASIQ